MEYFLRLAITEEFKHDRISKPFLLAGILVLLPQKKPPVPLIELD
jgi:hypothetical protein